MKKALLILIGATLLMSSCGSNEAAGAYTGGMFGNMLGSAIGGIAGGWRGSDIGAVVGTIGGAAAGAAIGASVDRAEHRTYEEQRERVQNGINTRIDNRRDQSGFDPQMRGDDRISFMGGMAEEPLTIHNAGIYETQRDGILVRGETCKVIFEIRNHSNRPVLDVFPLVEEVTGNKHVHISPNMRIESIAPHQAVRYTATLMADRGLRKGQVKVRIGVAHGDKLVESEVRQFTLATAKGLPRK